MRPIIIKTAAVILSVIAFGNARAAPREAGSIVQALELHGQNELQSQTLAQAILDYIINLPSIINNSEASHQQASTGENGKVSYVQDELHDKIPRDNNNIMLINLLYNYYSSISHDAKLYDYEHGGGADTQGQKRIWKED